MIHRKEFYFVRHGQTDHNIAEGNFLTKGEHAHDIPLNETGKSQALAIEPIIAKLPVEIVCASPYLRVQETKHLISTRLKVPHTDIADLGECTGLIWKEMVRMGMYSSLPKDGIARSFMDRIKSGINQALNTSGTPLVVAHGGVHWALCCLLDIKDHSWFINNCVPVHFGISNNQWTAKILEG